MHIEKVIQLPDLSFIRMCNEDYGVNRGLYNTIDKFFFESGFKQIVDRRRNVLYFLEYIQENTDAKNSRVKFGSGGLRMKIDEYLLELDKVSREVE